MLSFDVEEYFQVEAAAPRLPPEEWDTMQRRLPLAVDRVLDLLAEHNASATFFVLGWVARAEPQIVRRIADAGHEIASHGMNHSVIGRLTPQEFRDELMESRKLLEDLSGGAVIGYRAPTFSITHDTAWALDVLAEANFAYDSSVFPIRHDRYGVPDAPRFPHRATGPSGGSVLEIPPLTLRALGMNWPVGGGGYLRLFPVRIVGSVLRLAERNGRTGLLYLHPWELDPGQPVLPMGPFTRFRHRVRLAKTEGKLRWLLERFRFSDIRGQLEFLRQTALHTYAYGQIS